MKSIIFSAAALVAAVSAQTTTTVTPTSSATCGALPVLDQCLITTQGYVDLCQTTDYNCLCAKYNDMLTCFNNCPTDSRQSSYAQQRDLNCVNASVYSSSTTVASWTSTSSVAAAATTTGTASTRTSGTGTATATTSTASGATQSNGAGELAGGASGLLAAFAGAVLALL